MKYKLLLSALLATGLGLILLSGCGGPATIRTGDGNEAVLQGNEYEYLWVEPQIVVADSLITLIRSNRIDSIKTDPANRASQRPSAVDIRILAPDCEVRVGLLDGSLRLVYPLLLRRLPTGYYRMTLNADRFAEPDLPPGNYYLRADFCGRTEISMVTVD